MPKSSKPLTDKRWFQTTQGILALVGGAVGLAIGVVTLWPKPAVEPSKQYAEILIDSSEGMSRPFDGSTKMDVARNEIKNLFRNSLSVQDGLALRRFGGTCGPNDTELLLGFDKTTQSAIDNAAQKLFPSGQNSVVHGITEATSDFSHIDRDNPKRIIVIVGGGTRCNEDTANLTRKLEQFKKVGGTGLDVHYVGLGLTPEDQEQLSEIAKQSGGEIQYANSGKDLEQVLYQIVVVEPVISDARTIITILNSVVNQLNSVFQNVNASNYVEAKAGLDQAQKIWHKSDGNFAALKARHGQDFQQLFQRAEQQRSLQNQMLSTMSSVIRYAKSSNSEELHKAAVQYRDLADQYNGIIKESEAHLKQLGEHGS